MKGATPVFKENDYVGGNYKGSLYKKLFADRKNILEGYPAVKKGLAFPEPSLKYGSTNYSFKTTDVIDKVSCKHNGKEFQARYKKDTGKWDISCKQSFCPGVNTLFKYEERQAALPSYIIGCDMVKNALTLDMKFNPQTGVLKKSCLYNADDILKGLKIAGDLKGNVYDLNPALMRYNLGAAFASAAGVTACGINHDKIITVNHQISLDKQTAALVEVAASLGKAQPNCPVILGVAHSIDKDHQLRVRCNQSGQIQACLKKDFSPNLSVLMATCVDAQNLKALARPPAFGFKVVTKL